MVKQTRISFNKGAEYTEYRNTNLPAPVAYKAYIEGGQLSIRYCFLLISIFSFLLRFEIKPF